MDFQAIILRHRRRILFGLIPVLSFLMHFQIFPLDLQGIHAWRQAETMSNVVNFYERDFHPLHPRVNNLSWEDGLKRMEFPIMQWVFAWTYYLFGESIWMIRFLCFLIGLSAIWGMYSLSRWLFRDEWLATIAAWCFCWSPVFFYYTVNPMPDLLALMAGIWGLAYFVRWHREGEGWLLWISAGFLLLATLAKLPFVLFYGLPLGFALWDTLISRFRRIGRNAAVALPALLSLALPAAWYLKVIPTWQGNGVVGGILEASSSDLGNLAGIFMHNLVSTLPELMVNYAAFGFFFAGAVFLFRNRVRKRSLWPALATVAGGLAAYYLFELNMISTVHDYYLMPFLPFLFLTVAYGAGELWKMDRKWLRTIAVVALLAVPLTAALRSYPRWGKMGFPEDLITHRAELQAAVPEEAICLVGHDKSPHIFLYYLHKRGWNVDTEEMGVERFAYGMDNGATYFYSSSREFEGREGVAEHLYEQVAEYGIFKVWRLK